MAPAERASQENPHTCLRTLVFAYSPKYPESWEEPSGASGYPAVAGCKQRPRPQPFPPRQAKAQQDR
eukprot:15191571-Alexandrium_andersonii.AAC.1